MEVRSEKGGEKTERVSSEQEYMKQWMSVQRFDVIRGSVKFVGLGNYLNLFHDPQFGLSVLNTAWYTFTVVPLIVAGSIAIALFLRESRPARLLARVGFYIPFVLSPVVVATSWKWLLNEDLGVIDGFLKWAGASTIPWLTDDFSARVCVVAITVWNLVGFYMLMVLAGLSQISAELYEAARIEGTTAWQRFWNTVEWGHCWLTQFWQWCRCS
jgi:ABC-type sugar transport system permease subunit